ncbi:CASP-like protein 4A2 [Rhodamnia argentea]|uniref:CASP-like protein n=1 Tax=Rhodamnia argentea TaxID=178133 RepID=A0A8B8P9G1_9MYRT|nr:CASP-like protein 4A2 [Rhodamnia argentea]
MKKKPSLSSSRDSDSPTHPPESPHSPLRFHSPLRSDLGDPADTPPYASPAASPHNPPPPKPASPAADELAQLSPLPTPWPDARKAPPPPSPPDKGSAGDTEGSDESPAVVLSRAMRDEREAPATRLGGGGARAAPVTRLRRPRTWERLKRTALCFRVSEVVLCMISFSVMAADKTKGWSGDSYDRYKEYRYCLSVNVIAFVYAGFQACDLAFHSSTGKHVIRDQFRYYFDFFMDQILAYLLISASSSAATRVDDWKANWGRDKFTDMAGASIAMSFLAFMAFATSSLISGYNLFTHYL